MSKKRLTVALQVKELIFDIRNKSYLTGVVHEANGASYDVSSNMQATDDTDGYQIRRSLSNAFLALKVLLGEYVSENKSTCDNLIAKEIDTDGELVLELELPGNYNDSSADSLSNSIHSYLVDVVLAEWFMITDREDAEYYINRSVVDLDNIKRAFYRRKRPKRPDYS